MSIKRKTIIITGIVALVGLGFGVYAAIDHAAQTNTDTAKPKSATNQVTAPQSRKIVTASTPSAPVTKVATTNGANKATYYHYVYQEAPRMNAADTAERQPPSTATIEDLMATLNKQQCANKAGCAYILWKNQAAYDASKQAFKNDLAAAPTTYGAMLLGITDKQRNYSYYSTVNTTPRGSMPLKK